MLSPVLLLKPQNTTTSLLFSKTPLAQNTSTNRIQSHISLIYNTLQSSQPSYFHQLFTIQPPRSTSTRSSSTLTLLLPSVSSSLKFSNRSIAVAVPPLWNKLPPAL